jgi:hypothetical protein
MYIHVAMDRKFLEMKNYLIVDDEKPSVFRDVSGYKKLVVSYSINEKYLDCVCFAF